MYLVFYCKKFQIINYFNNFAISNFLYELNEFFSLISVYFFLMSKNCKNLVKMLMLSFIIKKKIINKHQIKKK